MHCIYTKFKKEEGPYLSIYYVVSSKKGSFSLKNIIVITTLFHTLCKMGIWGREQRASSLIQYLSHQYPCHVECIDGRVRWRFFFIQINSMINAVDLQRPAHGPACVLLPYFPIMCLAFFFLLPLDYFHIITYVHNQHPSFSKLSLFLSWNVGNTVGKNIRGNIIKLSHKCKKWQG